MPQAQPSREGDCDRTWKFESDFAQRFYACVGSSVALRQDALLRGREFRELNALDVKPENYQEPKHFAEDYQVAELLSKSRSIPGVSAEERKSAALSKLLQAEVTNAQTNQRLMGETLPDWFGLFSYNVLHILGPLGAAELEEIAESSRFGPGTNVGVAGDGLVPSIKYDTIPVCTKPLLDLLPGLMPARVAEFWGTPRDKARVVRGNAHFTVPKKWSIDRCAAKEPLWNSFLQAGIGQRIVKRLRRFGVDLHDQTWNQTLASMAWAWGLATVDLTSASDLLARVLVWLALCYNGDATGKRWYHLLCLARSPYMRMPGGDVHELEMFASMGNGFTFPLETVIFLSVMRTVVPREDWCLMTTYGDDIVVPQKYVHQVVERLEYLGFKVNGEKTRLAGVFFESCGTDWFKGQNVRPFYLRQDPKSPIPYPLQAANALRAWCLRVYGYLPQRYHVLWRWCKGQVPQVWRHPVPSHLGDVGLHVSLGEARRQGVGRAYNSAEYSGWEGYVVEHAMVRPVNTDRRTFGVLTAGLQRLSAPLESSSQGLEPIRGLYGRVRTEMSVVLWKDDFNW